MRNRARPPSTLQPATINHLDFPLFFSRLRWRVEKTRRFALTQIILLYYLYSLSFFYNQLFLLDRNTLSQPNQCAPLLPSTYNTIVLLPPHPSPLFCLNFDRFHNRYRKKNNIMSESDEEPRHGTTPSRRWTKQEDDTLARAVETYQVRTDRTLPPPPPGNHSSSFSHIFFLHLSCGVGSEKRPLHAL